MFNIGDKVTINKDYMECVERNKTEWEQGDVNVYHGDPEQWEDYNIDTATELTVVSLADNNGVCLDYPPMKYPFYAEQLTLVEEK